VPEQGKTTADVCVCGHTRYNHDPIRGCAVDDNYVVEPCPCTWFQDVEEPH
jgi:hypothetical protein